MFAKYIATFCFCFGFSLLLAGCSNTETENMLSESDVPIGFGVSVPSTGRALLTDASQMGSFKVWGWRTPEDRNVKGQVFDGTTVTYNENSAFHWTYSPTQSWILYNSYDFYACYPDTLSGVKFDMEGKMSFDYLDVRQPEEYNVDKALDVLHAYTREIVEDKPPTRVLLDFKHLLANVNFNIFKSAENEDDRIVVTGIVVGGMNCIGSLKQNEWTYYDTETSYFYTLPNKELNTDTPVSFNNLLMIPQSLSEDQPVDFIVQYNYTQAGSDKTSQKYLMVNLPDSPSWDAGKKIGYSATIYVDKNISFATPVIEAWGTEQVSGTVIIK